jgi:hypothetical protein
MLSRIQVYLWLPIILLALYTGWLFLGRRSGGHGAPAGPDYRAAEFERTYGGTEVKILQFYAEGASAQEGQRTLLCYGVLNAKSVRMEPPVEGLTPSINRCVGVTQVHNTKYTLIAEGKDGHTISASFDLAAHADEDALPKITRFAVVDRKRDYSGRMVYMISFSQTNGDEVSIDPPAFRTLHGAPTGQFYAAPDSTTTYTLTVKGKFGHQAQKTLTLEVPKI